MDPAGSHGLGDVFLRRILSSILLESGDHPSSLTTAEVELMTFRDVEVRREWRHIDLPAVDQENRLVVLIENKTGRAEGGATHDSRTGQPQGISRSLLHDSSQPPRPRSPGV